MEAVDPSSVGTQGHIALRGCDTRVLHGGTQHTIIATQPDSYQQCNPSMRITLKITRNGEGSKVAKLTLFPVNLYLTLYSTNHTSVKKLFGTGYSERPTRINIYTKDVFSAPMAMFVCFTTPDMRTHR